MAMALLSAVLLFPAAFIARFPGQEMAAAPGVADAGPSIRPIKGKGYQALFDESGATFTALDLAGRELRARFRLESIGRRNGTFAAPPIAHPRGTGDLVRYEHGTVAEIYDARDEGLEQSFEFVELPSGTGDLVVRVAVETELPVLRADDREVVFGTRPGDGIHVGEVVGIDANGARAPGALHWSNGVLELSLPGAFVERAALPLVLDPLISNAAVFATLSAFPLVTSAQMLAIDAAYLPGADLYCAVWVEHNSGGESGRESRGRLLNADGTPVGPSFSVDGSLSYSDRARVAAVASARRFAVVTIGGLGYSESAHIESVDEFGTVRGAPYSGFSCFFTDSVDVGGEATSAADDVIVAYSCSSIELAQIDILTFQIVRTLTLTPAVGDRSVAISKSGGDVGRYLVVWRHRPASPGEIWGAVVDRHLDVLVPRFPIAAAGSDEDLPDVDGDGTHWVVAWQRTNAGGDRDIVCRGVSYAETTGMISLGAERVVEGDAGQDEIEPAVAWMGESYLIGFVEQFGGADWDVFVRSVESIACQDCEGESLVFNPPTTEDAVAVASQRSGGAAADEALVAWITTTDQPLQFGLVEAFAEQRLFRADDGQVVDLGGGCGAGGIASATCASTQERARFGLLLDGAAPGARAFVALGIAPLGVGCGPCRLATDPFALLPVRTDGVGAASISLPFPKTVSMSGLDLLAQWLVDSPSGCSSLDAVPGFVYSLSNALEITPQ